MRPLSPLLYFIAFIEGGILTGIEITGSKLLAPYFGNSLYVWSATILSGLIALALGYLSGALVRNNKPEKTLALSLIFLALLFTNLMWNSDAFLNFLVRLPLIPGIITSCVILFTPVIFILGFLSPAIIRILVKHRKSGGVTGNVFAVSTSGGVFMAFISGWWLIPYKGISTTITVLGVANALTLILLLAFIYSGRRNE